MIVQIVSGCCWTRLWMDFRDLGFGNFSALCCTQWTEKGAWLSYYGTGAGPGLGQAQATELRATLHSQVFCPSLVAQKIAWKVKHASYRFYSADSVFLHIYSTLDQNLFINWLFLPDVLFKASFWENAMLCGKYNCGQMTQVWLWSLSPSAARSRALSVTQLLSSCHPVTQRDFGRNLTNNWQQFVTCFCNFVAGNLSWKLDNNNLDNDGATFPISCKMITSASD